MPSLIRMRSASFRLLTSPPTSTAAFLAVVLFFLGVTFCVAAPRGVPTQQGINNFGKVSDNLYRGAQPDAAVMTNLSKLGIKTIINLREPDKSWEAEIEQARAHGILFTNIPFKGLGSPNPEQVRKALAAIEALPSPIFIHCQHGCDRTGTIVACYRIQHDKWSTDAALKEAELYGISKFERGMRKYILSFDTLEK